MIRKKESPWKEQIVSSMGCFFLFVKKMTNFCVKFLCKKLVILYKKTIIKDNA